MRVLILAAGAALALTGCRNNDQTDNSQNVDENLTAENIVSNDVTAIDAVTGDAANMAADVNYQDFDNSVSNTGGNSTATPRKPVTKPSAKPAPAEPAPVSNAASNNAE